MKDENNMVIVQLVLTTLFRQAQYQTQTSSKGDGF